MAKKDMALLILENKMGKGKDAKTETESVEPTETEATSEESTYDVAAEEILAAIKSGSPKELGSLLKDFVSMCQGKSSDTEEEM